MKQKLFPVIDLEEPKARLERFLSVSDKRPNFLKRNLQNALGWNAVCVKYEWKPEKEEWWKRHIFGGEKMYVNPDYEKLAEFEFLNKNRPAWDTPAFQQFKDLAKKFMAAMNSITNDGEIGYANQAAEETPAANEDWFKTALSREMLANPAVQNGPAAADVFTQFDNPGGAGIAGSNKVYDALFPKRDDPDADNIGAGVDIVSFLTSYTTGDFNDGGTTIKNFAILDNASPIGATKLLTHGTIAAFNKTATDTLKFFINHEQRRV